MRTWKGKKHMVLVKTDGFDFGVGFTQAFRKLPTTLLVHDGTGICFWPEEGWRMKNEIKNCAIYCRKSSDEGLDMDFNTLDAQREACEAYITSQRSEGWKTVKTIIATAAIGRDTMERPALQNLLSDIKSGKLNIIVVYKIDRLTRSLMDFAKLVEVFDEHAVAFHQRNPEL